MIFNDIEAATERLLDHEVLITDSRSMVWPQKTIFAAVKTATGDGHRYINDMYRRGVRAFVVNHVPPALAEVAASSGDDCVFVVVDDVRNAITRLGAERRRASVDPAKMVAITGSRGKTVVKELIYSALRRVENPVRSPRSWNSHIGVALSLFELQPGYDHALIEVGIDGPGQIDALLVEAIRPRIGVLTSITDAHDGGFESREQKVREKLKLFAGCSDVVFDASCEPDIARIVEDALPGVCLHSVVVAPYSAEAVNKALAVETLRVLGYADRAEELVASVQSVSSRIDVHEGINDCVMLYDGFTADLRSLADALDFMRRRATRSRTMTVVLGDLQHAADTDLPGLYHQADDLLRAYGVDRLIGVGREIAANATCFDSLLSPVFFDSAEDFITGYSANDFNSELILIKGSDLGAFKLIKDRLESPRHDTIMEINLDAVVHNFNYYRSLVKPGTGLIAMVKASGYGTGSTELAKTLQSCRAAYLAVAVVDEGVALRQAGITMPILVLNPITNNYNALFDRRLEPTVFSLKEYLMLRNEALRRGIDEYPVHIKLDTGMHRLGFIEDELDELCRHLSQSSTLKVSSVFSHLATADCSDMNDYTMMQLDCFAHMSDRMRRLLPYPFKRHILNTAGIERFAEFEYDMVRLGIGLYGIDPMGDNPALATVATLTTTIIALRRWPAGTTIGYGRRGLLKRPSLIATIPIGYADGIDRHFGCGNASFMVRGHRCPTVGNICMDLAMIDVTDVPDATVGDVVEIFGPSNPITQLSNIQQTIPYEILTSVSPRVRRIYFRE